MLTTRQADCLYSPGEKTKKPFATKIDLILYLLLNFLKSNINKQQQKLSSSLIKLYPYLNSIPRRRGSWASATRLLSVSFVLSSR